MCKAKDVEITFKAIAKRVCTDEDLLDMDMTLREMIEMLVLEDGAFGIIEELIIVDVEEV